MSNHGHRFGILAASVVVAVGAFAPAAGADGTAIFRKLYREDANAGFELVHDQCEHARTMINLNFHQDFFQEGFTPPPRAVLFGVGIQELDCDAQFVAGYEGVESTPRRFDIAPGLSFASVHAKVQVCQASPVVGDCFPVAIDLVFKGIGAIDVDKEETHINDPDCIIEQAIVYKTRSAKVWGQVSFTPPGGTLTTYHLSNDVLSADGATLVTGSERTFMKGDGFNCTEH